MYDIASDISTVSSFIVLVEDVFMSFCQLSVRALQCTSTTAGVIVRWG